MSKVLRFLIDDSGATAAEYALLLALGGLGIVTGAAALRGEIAAGMNRSAAALASMS